MDAAGAFATNAVRTRFEDVPPAAIESAKRNVLDTIGCCLAGSAAPGGGEIAAVVQELGGRPEATLIGFGAKVSALDACLANGATADAHDFSDVHEESHMHAGIVTIPAALALAERMGGVSGSEFLTGLALSADMLCRMGLTMHKVPPTFHLTSIYGFMASAMTCGKLMRFDEEHMINAMGLGYVQSAGSKQGVSEGDLSKRMQAGLAARGGLLAALMAQKGITGPHNAIEGKFGAFNAYLPGYHYDAAPLTDNLGKHFEGANLSFKPYPCCRFAHTHIDAALALGHKHNIKADEIESITAHVNREPHIMFEPLDVKRNPKTLVHAQFSIPYTAALALLRGRVTFDDFATEAIRDPEIIAVANKVSPLLDATLRDHDPAQAILVVKTKRGTFTQRIEYPLGHPENPLGNEGLAAKFRDCAAQAANPPSDARLADIIATVARLEELADMRELTRLLA